MLVTGRSVAMWVLTPCDQLKVSSDRPSNVNKLCLNLVLSSNCRVARQVETGCGTSWAVFLFELSRCMFSLWLPSVSDPLLLPEPQLPPPAIDGVFGKDWCMDLWREDKLPPQTKDTVDPAAMTSMGAQVSESLTNRFIFLVFQHKWDEMTECPVLCLVYRQSIYWGENLISSMSKRRYMMIIPLDNIWGSQMTEKVSLDKKKKNYDNAKIFCDLTSFILIWQLLDCLRRTACFRDLLTSCSFTQGN